MRMTVKEFSKAQDIDAITANAVVKFLVGKNLVTKSEEVLKVEGKRGRPSVFYEFPDKVTVTF